MRKQATCLSLLACLLPSVHYSSAAPAVVSNELTLVKNGIASSVILVTADINEAAWFAAGELADHIHKITGTTIPILSDKAGTVVPEGIRILVGDSRYTYDIELSNMEFGEQEYLIRFTADTLILMGRDDLGSETLKPGPVNTNIIPHGYREQGTSYAVHDFLERYCDVRWYAAGPIGMVHPTTTTLTVTGAEIRRKPSFEFRSGTGVPNPMGMAPPATNNQMALHGARLRAGGMHYGVSHAFEVFPDRFLKKNPANPKAWEGARPDYFAKDANGDPIPDQMCYSSTGLVVQVVKDAKAIYSGKAVPGAIVSRNIFSVVPRDNNTICLCQKCKKHIGKASGHFSNGQASKLVWKFTIAVARQFATELPDKLVGQLAYRNYAFYPTGLTIPTNVVVGPCIWDGERLWSEEPSQYEYTNYKTWVSKAPGQLTSMWMYQCFPGESAGTGGFHYFMPFYGHVLQKQMRLFAKDGIRGIFHCGVAEYIDGYLTFKLMDDVTLDVDDMLPEFFSRYYGPASNEMANIYWKIEHAYTDLDNHPNVLGGMREETSWKYLGNAKVMGDLQFTMKKALDKVAGETNAYQIRVKQFGKDVLDYMDSGRNRYVMKVKYKTHAEAARKRKPPRAQAPLISVTATKPSGDPGKVDWKKVPLEEFKSANDGYPADRPASFQATHDGTTLYVRLNETTDTAKIEPGGLWWAGDHWAVFLARAEKGPYKYFRVPLNGAAEALAVDPDEIPATSESWATKLRVVQHVASNEWSVMAAIPLEAIDDAYPIKPGSRLYFNVIRNSFGGDSHLAWAPTFEAGYYSRSRAGFLTLLPR